MQQGFDPLLFAHANQGLQVFKGAVHAAIGDKSEQVQRTVVFFRLRNGIKKGAIVKELAVLDGIVDTHHILVDDAAAAQGQMPHFGVAHLTVGQAHGRAGCLDDRMRIAGEIVVASVMALLSLPGFTPKPSSTIRTTGRLGASGLLMIEVL